MQALTCIKHKLILVAVGLLTAAIWFAYPLIVRAFEKPEKPLLASTSITVLDPNVRTWEELERDPHFVENMVRYAFADAPIMVDIARAESRFDPTAKNPNSTATGVFQILVGTWAAYGCVGERTDASDNIKCARKIYDQDGTSPWNASSENW